MCCGLPSTMFTAVGTDTGLFGVGAVVVGTLILIAISVIFCMMI